MVKSKEQKVVLVVVAHGDDEVLGCGGAIAKHVSQGDDVGVIFMTDGVGSRANNERSVVRRREKQTAEALSCLGVTRFKRFSFADNAMDAVPLLEVVQAIEQYCLEQKTPDRIYTHYHGDLNVDHQVTNRAVLTCFRPQPNSLFAVNEIVSFEVLSSTHWNSVFANSHFSPNFYVDITETLDLKLKAMSSYAEEVKLWPHARSLAAIEHLARFRGAVIGVPAAEAFVVERMVEP